MVVSKIESQSEKSSLLVDNLSTEGLSKWNDDMVKKYHGEGTLFESKNFLLRYVEILRLKTIVKLAGISESDSVLDLGCGEGYLLRLLPKAKQIKGIDISRVALKRAESLISKYGIDATLEFGNAQDLKINEKFDKIMCSEMLEHVPDPRRVIKNIHAILEDDGLLVVSVPDEKRIKGIMSLLKSLGILRFLHAARKQKDYDWHLHEASVQFLRKISRGYFKVVKVKKVPPILNHRIVACLKKIV